MSAPVLNAAERKAFEAFVSTYSLEEPAPLDTWFAARDFYAERERVLREALEECKAYGVELAAEGHGRAQAIVLAARAALASPTPHPQRDLRAKLEEMRLHDNTGDPLDTGYMQAVEELTAWLASPTPQETT